MRNLTTTHHPHASQHWGTFQHIVRIERCELAQLFKVSMLPQNASNRRDWRVLKYVYPVKAIQSK